MSQIRWDIDNTVDSFFSRMRNTLVNKLPHSIINIIRSLSPGLKVFLLILLGYVLYGVPSGYVSNQTFQQIYGLQYIALFACVLLYGKRATIGLHLLLTFLKVLFTGITFRELISTGVHIDRFVVNLAIIQRNWLVLAIDMILVTCFIFLFTILLCLFYDNILKKKLVFALPLAHFSALAICIWSLTTIRTGFINVSLTGILTVSTVIMIISGSIAVLFLKAVWSNPNKQSPNIRSGIAGCLVFCIAAFIIAMVIPKDLLFRPNIISHPQDQTVRVGQSATFRVTAMGIGLSYRWQYYGTRGDDRTSAWRDLGEGMTLTRPGKASKTASVTASGTATRTLTMSNTTAASDGVFQIHCVVSNSVGSVTSNAASMTVTDRP